MLLVYLKNLQKVPQEFPVESVLMNAGFLQERKAFAGLEGISKGD
jgi:hypothetical protein